MTALIAGGLALVGTFVGGLLTGGRDLFFRKRDAKHQLQHGARLLYDEMGWLRTALDKICETGDPRHWDDPHQLVALWREYRSAMVNLPYDDWFKIEMAIRNMSMDITENVTRLRQKSGTTSVEDLADKEFAEIFRQLLERLDRARTVLERYL